LRERLADRYVVRGLDRHPAPDTAVGDVVEIDQVERAARGARAIVHLAGNPSPDAAWENVLRDNVVGTWTVFEAARRAGVPRVVFASSNHVVGRYESERAPALYELDDDFVVGADWEPKPDSPYALSKLIGEQIGRFYADTYGLAVVCLRIGSVLPADDPRVAAGGSAERFARYRATWLSHRDLAELVAAALRADVRWAVVYGVSDNPRRFWDPAPARDVLGFVARDRAPVAPASAR
jgi:NAD+ dependent glucose-6-phosphate dehydrogenase